MTRARPLFTPAFYLACSLDERDLAIRVGRYMRESGWHQTYDWTAHGRVSGAKRLESAALNYIDAVKRADVVIVLLTGQRQRGTHAELGAAIALKKPLVLWSHDFADFEPSKAACSFYHHPSAIWVTTIDDIPDACIQQNTYDGGRTA